MKKQYFLLLFLLLGALSLHAQLQNAMCFDGLNDFAPIYRSTETGIFGTNANNDSFTIEFWVKDKGNGGKHLYSKHYDSGTQKEGYFIEKSPTGTITVGIANTSNTWSTITGTRVINDGNWHHVAYTFDFNTNVIGLYVDGLPEGTLSGFTAVFGNNVDARLASSEHENTFFGGEFDEVKIWNTVKTGAEINNFKNAPLNTGSLPSDLILYYQCNEGTPGADNWVLYQLLDHTGNGRTGDLWNVSRWGSCSNWVNSVPSSALVSSPVVLSSSLPADDATNIAANSNIILTFNKNIAFGTGNIEIVDLTDGSSSLTIDVTSPGSQASISGGVLTINPSSDLDISTNYAVRIASTAIDDTDSNSYAGITNNTLLNFTTHTPDLTPSAFENSTPSSANIATTSFTLNTDIDEAGTIYYVVLADGATAPTSAEVKAGTGSGGSGQIKSGNAAVTTGGFTNAFNVTGLTLNTTYDVYVVAEDDESTPNIQATPTKVDVTTLGGGFIVVESGGSTSTNENGTTDTFTVALNSQPNSNVVINLSSGDVTEGTIDKSTLTFTNANWNVAQTVTVTGLDDGITDGSPSYNVTLSIDAALTDDAFDGAANKTVSVTNFDNEITAASAGADQNVCGTSTFLGGNSPNGGESGTWSIISGTGGSFGGVNSPTSSFSGTINTAYTLRWTIDNGGVSESTDDVVITLLDNPTVAAAGPDQNNIAGTATLAGNAVSGLNTTGTWTQVAGPGVVSFGDASSPTSTATVNLSGSYTFRWTSSNSTCPISSDDVVITYTSIAPAVTNSVAASITGNGAMISGNVTSDGNNTITERGFVYALTSNDATPTVAEVNGTTVIKIVSTGTTGNYNTTLTGLVGNREYAYVAFATNGAGTTESTIQTFTTINTSPTFTSTAVTTANENDTYTYTITTNDADGDAVVVTAPTKPSWLALDTNVTVSTLAGDGTAGFLNATGTAAKFNRPYGVAVDASGNVYIADLFNHQIRKISPTGIVTTLAGSTVGFANGTGATAQFNDPRGIAIDGSGNVYVADNQNHRIRKITPAGVVTTLAGSSQGYTDDIGTAAQFHSPTEVAVDKSGNVYVADNGNHRIRKITAAGVVTTLAGSGVAGFAEGTGTAAQFNQPFGITVDGAGNVYVADRLNHRIRKITSAGVVTTLAGSTLGFADGTGTAAQFSSPFGLDIDSFGNIYVADFNNKRIRKVSPAGVVTTVAGTGSSGLVNGVGSIAQFNFPAGVSVDASNNVYVADYSNNSVRKIEQKQVLTGTPTSTDVGNHNVVLEANDGNGGTVQQSFTISVNTKPTVSSSTATAIKATKATLNGNVSSDGGAAITERGFVYALSSDDSTPTVAEVNGTTVIKVVVSGTTGAFNKAITGLTVSGTYSFAAYAINSVGTTESSVATFTTINTPPTFTSSAITAVDEGDTYTYTITTNDVDADNLTITAPTKPSWLNLTTAPGGDVTTVAGTGSAGSTDGNGSAASFYSPTGVAVDGLGNVYVADAFNHRIRKIAPNGDVTTIAGSGIIGSMDGNGTSASFNSPWGIAVDDSGNVYVADTGNHSIRKITPNGDVTTFAGSGSLGNTDGNGTSASFKSPTGIAIDGSGNFYVVDAFNHNIRKITPNGDVTTIAGSGSPGNTDGNGTSANFSSPWGIAVDGSGNVYVADTGNNNIRKITPNGDATTLAGSGTAGNTDGNGTSASFNFPYGVAVDGSGNLYVSDGSNRKIRKIAPNGDVTTIAGTGSIGSTDANGTAASFYVPYGVALDGSEILYVTDQSNNKIRKISLPFATLTGNSTGQAGDHPVVLEANDGNGGTVQQMFTINVLPEPIVTLSVDNSSINEATGTATLTATLSNTFGKDVEVTIGYSGTALNGTDYNSTASTTITITAGQTSASAAVIITPINDTSPEGNETIIAEITGVTNGTENGNQTLEITLVDDDLIPAVITFADINKTYGDADFALEATSNSTGTISYSIVAGGTGSASLSGTNNGTLNVGNAGTVTIRATLPADGIYGAAKKDITLTIAKAVLVVTANNQTITYGDSFSIGFTYGEFKNGDDASVLDTGAFVFFVDPITSFDAGTYTIRAGAVNDNNYTASYVDGTFTISKATLTATADDKSKEYGEINPAFTISYSGFKGADTISDIDTAPTASSTATTTTDVGTVAITITGGTDNNYTIAPVNGTISIGKATLTATADDKSKEYGDANPTFTISYSGFKGADTASDIDTAPTASSTATTTTDVGTVAITTTGGTDNNYTITPVNGTLTIGKATLTATADDKSKEYGEVNPAFTISYSGFKGADTIADIDTAPTASSTATTSTDVGTVAITTTGGADNNYTITPVNGTLTISKATLTATADDKTKVFGQANPTFTISYSGFKGTDTASDIDTAPIASSTATTNTPAGTVPIELSAATDGNYTIVTVNGTLTILGDNDGDGIPDITDPDDDNDGVPDVDDNSYLPNPDQEDSNNNGIGDVQEDCDNDGILNYYDTENEGCQASIVMKKKYGFSPNGDGVNDTWVIENIALYPNNVVNIYNRSGKLVFSMKGYDNSFNGFSNKTSSSNKLPVGAYYFTVEFNTPGAKPAKGWIYINY